MAPQNGGLEGRWKAHGGGDGGGGEVEIEISLARAAAHRLSEIVLSVPRREADAALDRAGSRLELRREAGTLAFENFRGVADRGEAAGRFRFDANPQFAAEAERLGFAAPDAETLLELALHEVKLSYVREMAGLGFKDLSLGQVSAMSIHGVTPGYVRELARLGYRGLSPDRLVELQMHGLQPDCIRTLRRQGHARATLEDLEMLSMHGMAPCGAPDGTPAERP